VEPTDVPALHLPGVVARSLLEGEQVADLRLPSAGGPPPGSRRFWLIPSGEEPALKPAYRRARELSLPEEPPPAGHVRVEGWAELVGRGVTGLDAARVAALNSKSVLDLDALVTAAGGADVEVLALRAHRLVEPLTVPADLSGLPPDPSGGKSELVLSDVAFEARLKGLVEALPSGLSAG
jgi:hypothetical protein